MLECHSADGYKVTKRRRQKSAGRGENPTLFAFRKRFSRAQAAERRSDSGGRRRARLAHEFGSHLLAGRKTFEVRSALLLPENWFFHHALPQGPAGDPATISARHQSADVLSAGHEHCAFVYQDRAARESGRA